MQVNQKESGVNRVVGVSKEDEVSILAALKQALDTKIELSIEVEKSEQFRQIFEAVLMNLRIFFQRRGIDFPNFPIENIHLVSDKLDPKDEASKYLARTIFKRKDIPRASYVMDFQRIFIYEHIWRSGNLMTFHSLVHELIHFIMFASKQKKGGVFVDRRAGLEIVDKNGRRLFQMSNEFVTESLATEFEHEFFPQIAGLKDEYQERNMSVAKNALEFGRDPAKALERIALDKTEEVDGGYKTTIFERSYFKPIQEHNEIVNYIYDENKNDTNEDGSLKYKNRDDVWNMFVQAAYTGRILELARLVDKTYGKGAFRLMGENTIERK